VATGRVKQLRNENANLRAEKKIWEVHLCRVHAHLGQVIDPVILSLSKLASWLRTRACPSSVLTWQPDPDDGGSDVRIRIPAVLPETNHSP